MAIIPGALALAFPLPRSIRREIRLAGDAAQLAFAELSRAVARVTVVVVICKVAAPVARHHGPAESNQHAELQLHSAAHERQSLIQNPCQCF
jgi:hypothetical protein